MKNLLVLPALCFSISVLAAPVCIDFNSDPDGDGWGWENSDSCMIPTTTYPDAPVTIENGSVLSACLADANTLESSNNQLQTENDQLRQQIAALQSGTQAVCEDTDPVGDGWGWNGSTTCRTDGTAAPLVSGVDYTNVVPTCHEARQRILQHVEIGMTEAEVRRLIGKPFETRVYSQRTYFTWYINNVDFENGRVDEYDAAYPSACDLYDQTYLN